MVRVRRERGLREGTHFFYIAENGYSFHFNRIMTGGRVSLRCINYRRRCYARASCAADGSDFRPGYTRHRCQPNRYHVHCRRFRNKLLNACRNRQNARLSLRDIYDDVRRNCGYPRPALVSLPWVKIRPAMQRARASTLPPVPHTLSELAAVLEQDQYAFLSKTLDGEESIYMGKYGQSHLRTRVVIFASPRMLMYMSEVEDLLSDGTFSSVPADLECAQIWNIITLRRHHVIPLVRVFMQSKLQACYQVALQAIHQMLPGFRPRRVMCDFEFAQANAWEIEFPTIEVDGCLFHSSKAIAGHAKEIGLTNLIRENEEADSIVRSLCGLALLPHWLLDEGLVTIAIRCGEAQLMVVMEPMLQYVRDTWYTPSRKRMFSVYGKKYRTDNGSESGNATMRSAMRQTHPNVWSCMFALQHLEDVTKFDIDVLDAGFEASRQRGSSVLANDEAIRGHTSDLMNNHINIDTFLRRVSYRIKNVYDMILDL